MGASLHTSEIFHASETNDRIFKQNTWQFSPEPLPPRLKRPDRFPRIHVQPAPESAQEDTLSMTEEIVRVEKEIDERVKGLYGV